MNFNAIRKEIYETVHVYDNRKISIAYKFFMIATACISLIPLFYKEPNPIFKITDNICLIIFVIDYILRWISIDFKIGKKWTSFLRFPFRIFPIIDMMSIISLASDLFGFAHLLGFAKLIKVFRIVRILKYSKSVRTIMKILQRSKKPLTAVASLALGYILISALIMFNVEPNNFTSFFDAVYWSTILLTTVGYGDICPATTIGRSITILSSFFGIAIVALPAGIFTAEYLNTLQKTCDEEDKNSKF